MTRHPENRNLRLHYEDTFHNLPVLASDDRPLVQTIWRPWSKSLTRQWKIIPESLSSG